MPLYLSRVEGTVRLNGGVLDPRLPNAVYPVSTPDCIQTGPDGRVAVYLDIEARQLAAVVSGPAVTVKMVVPPSDSLIRWYYSYSYRRQLGTSGGSIGIQG